MKQKLFFYLLFLSSIMTAQIQNFNMKVKFNDVDKSTSLTNSQILVRHPTTNLLMWVEPSLVTNGFIPITHVVNGITQTNINNWNSAYTYANTQRVLTLNETLGSIKIDDGTTNILTGLGVLNKPDAHSRIGSLGLTTIYNTSGSTNYPGSSGGGLRFNRHQSNTNSTGFEIWTAASSNQNIYFRKFWGTDGEGEWKIFADRDWVNTQLNTQMSNYVPFTGANNNVNLGDRNIASLGYYFNNEYSPTSETKGYQTFVSMSGNRYLTFKLTEKIYSVNTRMQIDIAVRENASNIRPGNISIGLRLGSDISAIVSDELFDEIVYYEDEDTSYITVKLRNAYANASINITNASIFAETIRQNTLDLSDKTNVVYAPIKVQAYNDEVLKLTGGEMTGKIRLGGQATTGIERQARSGGWNNPLIEVKTVDNSETIGGFNAYGVGDDFKKFYFGTALNTDEWFRVHSNGNIEYAGTVSKIGGSANNILLEDGSVLDKNTLATTAQLPTVGNGNISYQGTGSITGGGVSAANQSGDTAYEFDLTSATKNDIQKGVTAHSWGNHAGLYPLLSSTYANPSWITSLDWSKITNKPNIPSQLVYTGSNGINVTDTVISPTYGTTANTIAQGNDARINNGQTAFDWGNFRDFGLGNIAARTIDQLGGTNNDWNTLPHSLTAFVFGSNTSLNYPGAPNEYPLGIKIGYNSNIGATILVGRGNIPELRFRSDNSSNSYPWARVYHDKNLLSGTLVQLNAGTSTDDKIWTPKTLNDWIASKNYLTQIPIATSSVLGGIKVGSNLSITSDGTLSATNTTYSTGSLAQLNAGTETTGRLQSAKNLNDWINGKNFLTQSSSGDFVNKSGINLVSNDFSIRSGTQDIFIDPFYGMIIRNNQDITNHITVGSDDGFAIQYNLGNREVALTTRGISGREVKSWSLLKDDSDERVSKLLMPETGSTSRRLAVSVNGNYANSSGDINIPISTPSNAQINITGVGNIEGEARFDLNQPNNESFTFDLTPAAKTDIAKGVEAYGWGDHSQEGYARKVIYVIPETITIPSGPFDIPLLHTCPLDYDYNFINWDITWNWFTTVNRQLRTIKTEYHSKSAVPLRIKAPTTGGCPSLVGDLSHEVIIPAGAKIILEY